jgi:hypothetical protein
MLRKEQKGSSSFLKKRTKKLLPVALSGQFDGAKKNRLHQIRGATSC